MKENVFLSFLLAFLLFAGILIFLIVFDSREIVIPENNPYFTPHLLFEEPYQVFINENNSWVYSSEFINESWFKLNCGFVYYNISQYYSHDYVFNNSLQIYKCKNNTLVYFGKDRE